MLEIVCECVYLNSQSVACNAHAAEALRSYWQEELAATNSFLKKHPVFDTPGPHSVARLLHGLGAICVQDPDCNPDFVVPLRLYGDGADAYRYLAYIIRHTNMRGIPHEINVRLYLKANRSSRFSHSWLSQRMNLRRPP